MIPREIIKKIRQIEIRTNRIVKILIALIPGNGTVKLLFGDAPEDEAAFHSRYFASSMTLTSSHETMSLGLSRWSSRRRSISSASPGVSSFDSTIHPRDRGTVRFVPRAEVRGLL